MRSDIVKKGATRCAHRSLFHANGYGEEDLKKPLIGICNSFNEIIPGHIHLREIAEAHPNGTAAVFSHGMAIRLTVGTLQGLSLHEIDGTGHAENTAVSCLEYEDSAFRVAYRDDASHLENGLQTLKRQAWLKNACGFEGGIYYVPSGAEGHFDVCRA